MVAGGVPHQDTGHLHGQELPIRAAARREARFALETNKVSAFLRIPEQIVIFLP